MTRLGCSTRVGQLHADRNGGSKGIVVATVVGMGAMSDAIMMRVVIAGRRATTMPLLEERHKGSRRRGVIRIVRHRRESLVCRHHHCVRGGTRGLPHFTEEEEGVLPVAAVD